MHLAGVTGLHHEADAGARLLSHEMLVDRGGEQERGDGRQARVGVAVGQDDDVRAQGDGDAHPLADVLDGGAQGVTASGGVEQTVDGEGLVSRGLAVLVDVRQLGELVVVDDRVGQDDLPA